MQHLIEQGSGAPDKRLATAILFRARRLANQHPISIGIANAKHGLCSTFRKFASNAVYNALTQSVPVERIVICEIEPLVPESAGVYFAAENYDVVNDPRVEIVFDDARHFIATTRETFDVITSDPIHPWVRGAASLYAGVRGRSSAGASPTPSTPRSTMPKRTATGNRSSGTGPCPSPGRSTTAPAPELNYSLKTGGRVIDSSG